MLKTKTYLLWNRFAIMFFSKKADIAISIVSGILFFSTPIISFSFRFKKTTKKTFRWKIGVSTEPHLCVHLLFFNVNFLINGSNLKFYRSK
jgi:hypothetical protein